MSTQTDLTVPARMQKRTRDKNGRAIPWYVVMVDGEPDFTLARPMGISDAARFKLCFLCGEALGSYAAFVVEPVRAVDRASTAPPAHRDCAQYVALAGLTDNLNPALVWVTKRWYVRMDRKGQPMFDIGKADQTYWYADGRDATREEVLEAIDSGMPPLREAAEKAGHLSVLQLDAAVETARKLAPA